MYLHKILRKSTDTLEQIIDPIIEEYVPEQTTNVNENRTDTEDDIVETEESIFEQTTIAVNENELVKEVKIIEQKTPEKTIGEESSTATGDNNAYSKVLPGVIVPSPFKSSLFFPDKSTSKKTLKKKREKFHQ